MAQKRTTKQVIVAVAVTVCALALWASNSHKNDKQVLCEVREDSLAIQVVSYKDVASPAATAFGALVNRGASSKVLRTGVYFDSSARKALSRWLIPNLAVNEFAELCSASHVSGATLVVFPAATGRTNSNNQMIASFDGGGTFNYFTLPEFGAPFLLDQGDTLLPGSQEWVTRQVSVHSGIVTLRQVSSIYQLDELDSLLQGKDCRTCGPVMFRELNSSDRARHWTLGAYGVLRPEAVPVNSRPLVVGAYYAAVETNGLDNVSGRFTGKILACPRILSSLTLEQRLGGCVLESNVHHEIDAEYDTREK